MPNLIEIPRSWGEAQIVSGVLELDLRSKRKVWWVSLHLELGLGVGVVLPDEFGASQARLFER